MEYIVKSVEIARQARDDFWADELNRKNRIKPFVIGSVSSYGSFLYGHEYVGDYIKTENEYKDHFRCQVTALQNAGCDIVGFEAFSRLDECKAVCQLLKEEFPNTLAYFAWTCKDAEHLGSGDSIKEATAFMDKQDQVAMISCNCTNPQYMDKMIEVMMS